MIEDMIFPMMIPINLWMMFSHIYDDIYIYGILWYKYHQFMNDDIYIIPSGYD
jgi:hypothetical protein